MAKGRVFGVAIAAVAGIAMAAGATTTMSSCAATPTNIPVRSFQQARNVDYLCVAYNDPDGGAVLGPTANEGLNQNLCTQVPLGVTGSTLANHLLALVTQGARGEVAVVDLTSGGIVDESHDRPGTNFIPVGAVPTGIVVAPDARMTFVASADTNKPAIYGIPTNGRKVATGANAGITIAGVLGDSTGQAPDIAPMELTDLPVCALRQPPQAISVVPIAPQQGGPQAGYVIAAVLNGGSGQPARVVTIDPTGMLAGVGLGASAAGDAGVAGDAGDAADGGDAGAGAGATAVTPGILAPCAILGSQVLHPPPSTTWSAGPTWPDGIPYADAGNLASQEPAAGPGCMVPEAGALPLVADPNARPYPAHAVMRDDLPLLYVGDAALPLIHVFDLSNPALPIERDPLLATSVGQSAPRDGGAFAAMPVIGVGDMAISPVTRDYKRYLYAVDTGDGSVMVFDVTDPATSPRTPLQRPHPELNPVAPRDRLSFSSPVAAVGFATHDWPIIPPGPGGAANRDQTHAFTGLLCNPNPNAVVDGGSGDASVVLDNGFYYTTSQVTVPYASGTVQLMPLRLRGVFGFVTLTNGQVVTIDVDDWDAPCRRPDPMTTMPGSPNYAPTGLLDLPEPNPGPPGSPTFLDPYAAPFSTPPPYTQSSSVTQEAFFPVSAPHRMRSGALLRNDPNSGNNAPSLVALPALTDVSGSEVVPGTGGVTPLILPTALDGFLDPTQVLDPTDPVANQQFVPDASILPSAETSPGIRLSFDDPTASQNQSWTVTYEGVIPTLNTVAADIIAPGADAGTDYETLTFSIGQELTGQTGPSSGFPAPGLGPGFCERGIEDHDIGQQRAEEAVGAMTDAGLPPPPKLETWTGDYVEIVDDPLVQGDPYWTVENSCWDGLVDGDTCLSSHGSKCKAPQSLADARYNVCNQTFGTGSPDTHLARDLPILRAYEDHLDVGRFTWPVGATEGIANRSVVGQDETNKVSLRFVSCCFHNQATFKVRAGGEWVAAGQNGVGFLHHVVASSTPETDPLSGSQGLKCVLSCDPHDVLLNSRSFDIPWAPIPWGMAGSGPHDAGLEEADARAEGGVDAGPGSLSCSPPHGLPSIPRSSLLALQNPYFSYVTWMGCALPGTSNDHTITARDDTWRFQVGGGFAPLTISLTGNALVDISPQSMRYIQPLGWMAVVDGQSQGLELIDLNAVQVVHAYY